MKVLPIYLLYIFISCHSYRQDDRAMLNAGCTTKFDQQQLDLRRFMSVENQVKTPNFASLIIPRHQLVGYWEIIHEIAIHADSKAMLLNTQGEIIAEVPKHEMANNLPPYHLQQALDSGCKLWINQYSDGRYRLSLMPTLLGGSYNSDEKYLNPISENDSDGASNYSGDVINDEGYDSDTTQGKQLKSISNAEHREDQENHLLKKLIKAINTSCLEQVKNILKKINSETLREDLEKNEQTLLHIAAKAGNKEVFDVLCDWLGLAKQLITRLDSNKESVLSLCFRNCHWELANYLHNKLQLSYGIDVLLKLYTSLRSLPPENRSVIICNLLTKNGQKFLAYLFEYNYEVAKNVAEDEDVNKESRAALYYHMSQWQEYCNNSIETAGSDEANESAIALIEKAYLLTDDDALKKLYQAYWATLYLAAINELDESETDSLYEAALKQAEGAGGIQEENKLATFFINYVKTACALWQYYKKEGEQEAYIHYYQSMINSYDELEPDDRNDAAASKITACFGELDNEESRKMAFRATTQLLTSNQAGSVLFGKKNLVERPYRSFKHQRLQQLLKQVATQLYFKATDTGTKLVELQLMYCEGANDKLFIAANKLADATKLFTTILQGEGLQSILKKTYSPADKEGKIRSARYAKKLSRLFTNANHFDGNGEYDWDLGRVEKVVNILKADSPQVLELKYNKRKNFTKATKNSVENVMKDSAASLYFVTGACGVHAERHAEEFLCDIAKIYQEVSKEKNSGYYVCISGKMRPCVGCTGRMQASLSMLGQKPGKAWMHTLKNQSPKVAKKSLKILFGQPTHISLDKDGNQIPSYDSGSDSEIESKEAEPLKALTTQVNKLQEASETYCSSLGETWKINELLYCCKTDKSVSKCVEDAFKNRQADLVAWKKVLKEWKSMLDGNEVDCSDEKDNGLIQACQAKIKAYRKACETYEKAQAATNQLSLKAAGIIPLERLPCTMLARSVPEFKAQVERAQADLTETLSITQTSLKAYDEQSEQSAKLLSEISTYDNLEKLRKTLGEWRTYLKAWGTGLLSDQRNISPQGSKFKEAIVAYHEAQKATAKLAEQVANKIPKEYQRKSDSDFENQYNATSNQESSGDLEALAEKVAQLIKKPPADSLRQGGNLTLGQEYEEKGNEEKQSKH